MLSLFEWLLPGYESLGSWVCGMDVPNVIQASKRDMGLLSMAQPRSIVCHFRLNKPDSEKSLMLDVSILTCPTREEQRMRPQPCK